MAISIESLLSTPDSVDRALRAANQFDAGIGAVLKNVDAFLRPLHAALNRIAECVAPFAKFVARVGEFIADAMSSFAAVGAKFLVAAIVFVREQQLFEQRARSRPPQLGKRGWVWPVDASFPALRMLLGVEPDAIDGFFDRFYSDDENVQYLWSVVSGDEATMRPDAVRALRRAKLLFEASDFEGSCQALVCLLEGELRDAGISNNNGDVRHMRTRLAAWSASEDLFTSVVARSLRTYVMDLFRFVDFKNGPFPNRPNRHLMAHGVRFVGDRVHVLQLLQAYRAVLHLRGSSVAPLALSLPDVAMA